MIYRMVLCNQAQKNNAMKTKNLAEYPLDELKTIYQILHSQITQHPALMDSELLEQLQRYLQHQASLDGVDVSLHAQWATWLNGSAKLTGVSG